VIESLSAVAVKAGRITKAKNRQNCYQARTIYKTLKTKVRQKKKHRTKTLKKFPVEN